jgi:peptide deformylase
MMPAVDVDKLTILVYPDPHLRKKCRPVREFDDDLRALADRMLELMREAGGVGLAAAQVGVSKRVFVMNATGEPDGDRAFVNPVIVERYGTRETEEGCLSIPDVRVQVRRALGCRIQAQTPEGEPFDLEGEELIARIWQHEVDHLDGKLIIDRMGPGDRIATRRLLRDLEDKYKARPKARR